MTVKLPVPASEPELRARVLTLVVAKPISVPPDRVSVRLKVELSPKVRTLAGIIKSSLARREAIDAVLFNVTGLFPIEPMRTFEVAPGTDPPSQLAAVFQRLSFPPIQQIFPGLQICEKPPEDVIVFKPPTFNPPATNNS